LFHSLTRIYHFLLLDKQRMHQSMWAERDRSRKRSGAGQKFSE